MDTIEMEEDTLEYYPLKLPLGDIMGAIKLTLYGDTYYSFEGIPYGQPPLGKLRFKAPIPVEPWAGVWECIEFTTKPMQVNSLTGATEGSEDCLYLNVYAKTLTPGDKPLPVFVWIYGGSFGCGAATRQLYSPDYFMMENIVVVTLNYRVSALGFLCVKDPDVNVPGNAGLKDQILALKWVKEYIEFFNGDPNNITLAGNSAGSCSIHYLLASEQAKGLFHKAICMSGTVFNPWAITTPEDFAYRVAKLHGYLGDDQDDLVIEFLQTVDADLLADSNILGCEDYDKGIVLPFAPCIEPYITDECVIPSEPREMLKTAWGNAIPVIFSGTSDEGLLLHRLCMHNEDMMVTFKYTPEELLPYEVIHSLDDTRLKELVENILDSQFLYNDDPEPSLNDLIHFFGVKTFWHGIHRSLLSRLEYSDAPTYLFRFSYDSPNFNRSRRKDYGETIKSGASHADDVSYLWLGHYSWELETSGMEYQIVRTMISIMTNIARSSSEEMIQQTVTLDDEVDCEELVWDPINSSDPHKALDIGETISIVRLPISSELIMWDALYDPDELF